jgi:hypothetical protein
MERDMTDKSMSEKELKRFHTLLKQTKSYLEYGSGASTLMAAECGIPEIVSVESDESWGDKVVHNMAQPYKGNFTLLRIDLGPVDKWGTPATESKWKDYYKYPLSAWDNAMHFNRPPDIVLIDGRFRLACFIASVLYAPVGTRILVHDYAKRTNYHVMEKYLKKERITDTMAEFVVPLPSGPIGIESAIQAESLWRGLMIAVTDVR